MNRCIVFGFLAASRTSPSRSKSPGSPNSLTSDLGRATRMLADRPTRPAALQRPAPLPPARPASAPALHRPTQQRNQRVAEALAAARRATRTNTMPAGLAATSQSAASAIAAAKSALNAASAAPLAVNFASRAASPSGRPPPGAAAAAALRSWHDTSLSTHSAAAAAAAPPPVSQYSSAAVGTSSQPPPHQLQYTQYPQQPLHYAGLPAPQLPQPYPGLLPSSFGLSDFQSLGHIDQLKTDMLSLDTDINELESTLRLAAVHMG